MTWAVGGMGLVRDEGGRRGHLSPHYEL